jgi:GNAT superfamily N-acetyltransferase
VHKEQSASLRSTRDAAAVTAGSMTNQPFNIIVEEHFNQESMDAVGDPLDRFNTERAGAHHHQPLAILIENPVTGERQGGLWGESFYDWLFVKLFFIPDTLRGHGLGQRILTQAEEIAKARGCTGVWLDTFEFQARGFYEKLGYTVFGTINDFPKGFSRFFLQKRI